MWDLPDMEADSGGRRVVAAGGQEFTYIPCLNDDEAHIDAIEAIVEQEAAGWL